MFAKRHKARRAPVGAGPMCIGAIFWMHGCDGALLTLEPSAGKKFHKQRAEHREASTNYPDATILH